ncbi:AMP-binding protein, partial [bacterium]|nr:AMP-binding protein [bacterium]
EPDTVQQNIREIGAEALMLGPRQWENLASLVESKMMEAGPIRQKIYQMGIAVGKKVNIARLEGKKIPLAWQLVYPLADLAVLSHLRDNLGLQANYLAVSGGTGMAPDVFRFFHALGVKLRNVFGTTEMGLLTSHQGASFDLETVGGWYGVHPKLGSPLEWKFSDKGELLVKGGSGFNGYYKKPEATAEAVVDGWYHTGDAVNITDKNEVVYLDRLSDMRRLSTGHSYPPQFIETRLRFSPYIKEVMTLGNEERPFVSAFINIDADILGIWAEKQRIGYTTYTDLSQNPEICRLIKTEIERINYFLADGSKVKRFINLPKELDPDEDELTRSRKLRRKFLEQKYERFITAIYNGEEAFEASIPVKYQDGKTGILNAVVRVNSV